MTANGQAWTPIHAIADPPPRPPAGLTPQAVRQAPAPVDFLQPPDDQPLPPAATAAQPPGAAADRGQAEDSPPRPARTRARTRRAPTVLRLPARRHAAAAGAIVAVFVAGWAITRGARPEPQLVVPTVNIDVSGIAEQNRADLAAAVEAIRADSRPVIVVSEPLAWSGCPLTAEALTMIGVNRDTGQGLDPDRGGKVETQVRDLLAVGVPLRAMRLVVDTAPNLVVLDGTSSGAAGTALFACPAAAPAPTTTAAVTQ